MFLSDLSKALLKASLLLGIASPTTAQMIPFAFVKKNPGAGGTPPTFIASSSPSTGGGNTITVAKPAGLATGDLIVVWLSKNNTDAVTPPSAGWTNHENQSFSGYGAHLFTKIADASDVAATDFTFSFSTWSSDKHLVIAHYRGVDPVNPVTETTQNAGSTSTATLLGGTATGASTVVAIVTSGSMTTTPVGFTSRNSAGWATRMSDKVQSTAGTTGDFTATNTGGSWLAMLMIIKGT